MTGMLPIMGGYREAHRAMATQPSAGIAGVPQWQQPRQQQPQQQQQIKQQSPMFGVGLGQYGAGASREKTGQDSAIDSIFGGGSWGKEPTFNLYQSATQAPATQGPIGIDPDQWTETPSQPSGSTSPLTQNDSSLLAQIADLTTQWGNAKSSGNTTLATQLAQQSSSLQSQLSIPLAEMQSSWVPIVLQPWAKG